MDKFFSFFYNTPVKFFISFFYETHPILNFELTHDIYISKSTHSHHIQHKVESEIINMENKFNYFSDAIFLKI